MCDLLKYFFLSILLAGCLSEDEELKIDKILNNYSNSHLDVLVPSVCYENIINKLEKLKLKSEIKYRYSKFLALPNVYSNIDGYISLQTDLNHTMLELHRISSVITSSCYPSAKISFLNNDEGWLQLRNQLNTFQKQDVNIELIKVDSEKLHIFVNPIEVGYLKSLLDRTKKKSLEAEL